MNNPLTCKYCSKECFVIYKELSMQGKTQIGVCKDCFKLLEGKEQKVFVDELLKKTTCATCHSSIESINEGKALGCCGCYETFQSYITELLLKHVAIPDKLRHFLEQDTKFQLHNGRTPFVNAAPDLILQIEELEHALENALKAENYELAATYRDQLTQLKLSQDKPSL